VTPESLLIYYGYPGLINGSQELDQAMDTFEAIVGSYWVMVCKEWIIPSID